MLADGGILLEDCLDLDILSRHGELVVGDGHAAQNHPPRLEVVASVRRGGQGDRRVGSCLGRRRKCFAVAVVEDGNGILDRYHDLVRLEDRLDLYLARRHGEGRGAVCRVGKGHCLAAGLHVPTGKVHVGSGCISGQRDNATFRSFGKVGNTTCDRNGILCYRGRAALHVQFARHEILRSRVS